MTPKPERPPKTGWPPGLLQDDCRALAKWFASRMDARRVVRANAQETMENAHAMNTILTTPQQRLLDEIKAGAKVMADYRGGPADNWSNWDFFMMSESEIDACDVRARALLRHGAVDVYTEPETRSKFLHVKAG